MKDGLILQTAEKLCMNGGNLVEILTAKIFLHDGSPADRGKGTVACIVSRSVWLDHA
jgi:hypothetical protein